MGCVSLAGCGNDLAADRATEEPAKDSSSLASTSTTTPITSTTARVTTTSGAASTSAAPTSTPPTDAPTSTAAPEPAQAPRAGADYVFDPGYGSQYAAFQTPSGNIGCDIQDGVAACVVGENSWDVPPPDEYCDATWGLSVEVASGPATLTCRGDATAQGPPLPYGHEIEFGPILCRSDESGVTCNHQDTGHGFKVNRASFDVY